MSTATASAVRSDSIDPGAVLRLGLGFFASKTVLSAVELGLFTVLAKAPADAESLRRRLGLHPRGARDFFDALVALDLLTRDAEGRYANAPDADAFLDREKPTYVGGLLEMANARLYGFWGALTEALRTGCPQNEVKHGGDVFASLYASPDKLAGFLGAMTGVSLGSAMAVAQRFPWSRYRRFADVGCAQGALPVQVARAHPHLSGVGVDLAPVAPIFEAYVARHGMSERLRFMAGDFFKDPLPQVDVLVMGHILHDWGLEEKQTLLRKAYAALPDGGALIVYEALIDDDRRANAFGLLMSLNMLIETPRGFDYTGAECCAWMRAAGFRETRVEHLAGPESMVVGTK